MMGQRRAPSVRTWFPDEVEAILRAVMMANGDLADAISSPEMKLYRRGFDAAVAAIAAAFQIDAPRRVKSVDDRTGGER